MIYIMRNNKLNFILFFIGLISCLFFMSCKSDTQQKRIKKEVKYLMGRTIDFNAHFNEVNSDTIIDNATIPDDCYRIVCFIPVKSCTKCVLSVVPILDSIRAEMNKISSTKLVVITDKDDVSLKEALSELNITSSLYSDVNNDYLRINKMSNVLDRNKTILIDNHNRVVIVGEPFHNSKMKDLYLKAVSE